MDEQQPYQTSSTVPDSRKRWLIPVIIAAVIIVGAAIAFWFLSGDDKPQMQNKSQNSQTSGSRDFKMTTDGTPVTYVGSSVYDACGLIPFATIRKNVNNYQEILDMNGTDKKPSEPLTIEHRYVDRTIAAALGKDAEPRPTAKEIGGQSGASVSASSFISEADSNCWYGQGNDLSLGLGKVFAKVYVTQHPTPLSGDLTTYLATLNKAGSEGDLDAYVEPQTDSGGFFTGIVTNVKQGVVVFVKASTKELAQVATVSVSDTLSQPPKGPMSLTYPLGWSAMPNPCRLLSASDFQQLTGKPASALAEDTMTLNEVGGRVMQRSCERLEVERLDGSPISKTYATVRLAPDETNAKKYVDTIKNDKNRYAIQQLKQKINLADDAYVATVLDSDKATGYELHMRIGSAIVIIAADTDNGLPASADEFIAKILPFARSAAQNYKK